MPSRGDEVNDILLNAAVKSAQQKGEKMPTFEERPSFKKWWMDVGIYHLPNVGEPPEHAAIAEVAWDAALRSAPPAASEERGLLARLWTDLVQYSGEKKCPVCGEDLHGTHEPFCSIGELAELHQPKDVQPRTCQEE